MQICKRKRAKKNRIYSCLISAKKEKLYSCVSKNKFIYHRCDENEKKNENAKMEKERSKNIMICSNFD